MQILTRSESAHTDACSAVDATLKQLLAKNSQNADAHKLMGLTLFFYKEEGMAERELRTALRLRPQDIEALYYLGRVYYTQNNFPPAVDALRECAKAIEELLPESLAGAKAKPSVGQGNWASVPWIAVLDPRETETTRHG